MQSENDLSTEYQSVGSARRIALAYLVVASAWIVVSGAVVEWLPVDRSTERTIEEFKGIGFVLVTGGTLFVLLQRQYGRLKRSADRLNAAHTALAEYAAFPRLSPNPIVAIDARGEITWANPVAHESARDGSIRSILPPNISEIADQCLSAGSVENVRHVAAGRAWLWSFFPNADADGTYGYGSDRTREERLEAQLARTARMESIGRLAAGLSHDFNNVLTTIGGFSQLLAEDLPPGDQRADDVEAIRDAARTGADLVAKLMLLGRDRPADQRLMDLNAEIQQLLPLLRHLVRSGIVLTYRSRPDIASVMFNSSELEQVLMNLVSNASDAMPNGGTVTISTAASPSETGVRQVISVADTGTGIPAEILPDIFDPFFTTKPAGKGTGLGLASVYSIVTAHDGFVEVENLNPGAVFRLLFPAAPAL